MLDYRLYDDLFYDDPAMFFSTAAGPAEDDIFGPPSAVLAVYGDGSPMLGAERGISQNVYAHRGAGSGTHHTNFFHRGDVQAAVIAIIGYWMIREYMRD